MDDGFDALNVIVLIQCDFHGFRVLGVPNTTVGKSVPVDLEVTKLLLDLLQDPDNHFLGSGQL